MTLLSPQLLRVFWAQGKSQHDFGRPPVWRTGLRARQNPPRFPVLEPPRLFESFLQGRSYSEGPDVTARICGICPVAYQMSSCHAMEDAFGAQVGGQLRALRRLLYCGEWIESHTLHIYLLHAPEFLGYEDVVRMAKDHREIVERAQKLKKIGNDIVRTFGDREIHPINVRVGGFHRLPAKKGLAPLAESPALGPRCRG